MKKKKRIRKSIILRRRRILGLVILSATLISIILLTKTIYIKIRCKSLNYSINYYLTNNSTDKELMRIKDFSLIFYDKDIAIVEAYGLKKEAPHKSLTIEGRFEKNTFGSWILETTYLIDD